LEIIIDFLKDVTRDRITGGPSNGRQGKRRVSQSGFPLEGRNSHADRTGQLDASAATEGESMQACASHGVDA